MDPAKQELPIPLPEDANRSSFRNVVFFRIPDSRRVLKLKVVIPNNTPHRETPLELTIFFLVT
jgi:hypothetical protein